CCFLPDIDAQLVETGVEADDERPASRPQGGSAIDELRRRFDYRFQQKPVKEDERGYGSGPAQRFPRSAQQGGTRSSGGTYGASRFGTVPGGSARPAAPKQQPDPALVRTPRPAT
ncbi:MAG: ATP-dependent DNA helicase, partial [Alistipes sp.]|nr:ATP-dependent DNA helicase [Alistipes sp.]